MILRGKTLRCRDLLFVARAVACCACLINAGAAQAVAQGVSASVRVEIQHQSREQKHESTQAVATDSSGVVVWLSPLSFAEANRVRTADTGGYKLVQKNKQFTPHILVVPTGSSVEFPNLDPFFHNVFSLFQGKRFDLGLYEAGSQRSVRFDREGVSYIFCNIHPEMGAVIISLGTPYYGVSDAEGRVAIHSVPPGVYQLRFWSENVADDALLAASRRVQITNQDTQLGVATFTATADPIAHHKNKFGEEYKLEPVKPY